MSALDAQDFIVLNLALDLLSKHTDDELSKARQKNNSAKQMAMITMRTQIVNTRAKVVMLRGEA